MEQVGWRIAAATVVGTSHIRANTPCQDSHEIRLLPSNEGEVLLLVASDGAGSAPHSDRGSKLACLELVKLAQHFLKNEGRVATLTKPAVHEWLEAVANAIGILANQDGNTIREYACTLLGCLISSTHAAYFQVGDGAMVVRSGEEEWSYVFWPQHGEFINTTHFLTDPSSLENFEYDMRADAIEEIAVFTDGIESLVLHYASQTVHAPFFNRIFSPVRSIEQTGQNAEISDKLGAYLESDAICQRTDDDKTLLLASRLTATQKSIIST